MKHSNFPKFGQNTCALLLSFSAATPTIRKVSIVPIHQGHCLLNAKLRSRDFHYCHHLA
jgi:hypothetical protein